MSIAGRVTFGSATQPPARRDGVRLLVAGRILTHTTFSDIGRFLAEGDLVVVNTSATLPAAVQTTDFTVHFATEHDDGSWIVEVRPPGRATGPLDGLVAGMRLMLPDGVPLTLIEQTTARLWRARVAVEGGVVAYLRRHGRAIRYAYVPELWPISDYQTVFAREPGSAEMPSAGRPFTAELVTELVARGVRVAPITLHCGVSSPEPGEPPQPERFRVGAATARLVNDTRRDGRRVVAVGTTVTRALETAADRSGVVQAAAGWTNLVLGRRRGARVVTGLVSGWHEAGASHLDLLEAVAGSALVAGAYVAAQAHGYLAHEFGDSALFLP